MAQQALTTKGAARWLVPAGAGKDERSRLGRFARWLAGQAQLATEAGQARPWARYTPPDLAAYRDHLAAQDLAPASIAAHLSTVRSRYARLIGDNATRKALHALAARQAPGAGPADQKAVVDELLIQLENAIDPQAAPVKTLSQQDRPDSAQLRLTAGQANALLAAPGVDSLQGLRDTAILAVLLCTGIREAELAGLDVADLRQRLGGELALHVRNGKGRKARLVPYGEQAWCLAVVDRWLAAAGIESGPAFRGLYRGGRVRPQRLSLRAVGYVVGAYPVVVDGQLLTVTPHDLRRTYARLLYEAGVDLVAIQQNLGHKSLSTTLGYIGQLDAAARRAPALYAFDLAALARAPQQATLPA